MLRPESKLPPVTVRVDDVRDCDTATLRETLACVEYTLAKMQQRRMALVAVLAERDATTANGTDDDDMPTPDDDPHAEFTDDGAYYPDVMTTELVADGPSGRVSVMADDIEARQLLASVGITLAKGGR